MFESFGYNGVFEMNVELVNRLVAANLYEKNLVSIDGKVSDADFLPPINIATASGSGSGSVRVYLLLGRPELTFAGTDGTNGLTLFMPMFGIGLFESVAGQVRRRPLTLGSSGLGLAIKNIRVTPEADKISVSLAKVVTEDVEMRGFIFEDPPSHVGGVALANTTLTDAQVDAYLSTAGVAITAQDLRATIAAQVRQGVLGPVSFVFKPSGLAPELSEWDLSTFDGSGGGAAGAVLELCGPNEAGKGQRGDVVDFIPAAPAPPVYRWSACIRTSILLTLFDQELRKSMFPEQGGTLNTPEVPTGYMVVPRIGQHTYSLPGRIECIAVTSPTDRYVEVRITRGLTAHGRAEITEENSGRKVEVWADSDGSGTVSIMANGGDRLAIMVVAISATGDPSTVFWRPRFSFLDGALRLDFHFYRYLSGSCMDAEGDGYIVVALKADRTERFKFTPLVIDSNFEIPLWVWATGFFGGFLLGSVGAALSEASIAVFLEDYVRDEIDPQGQVDTLLRSVSDKLPQPKAPGTAVFLDDLVVSEAGLMMAGRGDAGRILSYGRGAALATSPGIVISDSGYYLAIDWQSSSGAINVTIRGFSSLSQGGADAFWWETFDDLPRPPFATVAPVKWLSPGESGLFYHDTEAGLAKVLVERQPATEADPQGLQILVTWILFQKRVTQSVRIRNEVKATVVGSFESLTLSTTWYRYEGRLSLDRTKFFLTSDTADCGDEHWYWDDVEVTPAGIDFPEIGYVKVNSSAHELLIKYDETKLPPDQPAPNFHWVRFEGVDVFGRKQSHKYLLQTPAHALRPKAIAILPAAGWRDPREPLRDPIRDRLAIARSVLAIAVAREPALESTARVIMAGLSNHNPTLDARTAEALLSLVGASLGSP